MQPLLCEHEPQDPPNMETPDMHISRPQLTEEWSKARRLHHGLHDAPSSLGLLSFVTPPQRKYSALDQIGNTTLRLTSTRP
jgi:hypothetical protein